MKPLVLVVAALLAPAVAFADGAKLTGTVRYAGPAKAGAPLAVTQDGPVCGASKPDEALLVAAGGGLRYAVVSLVGVPAGARPPPATAKIEQKGCAFVPHVQALPVGTTLTVGNDDGVLHNVHAFTEDGGTLFNVAMPMAKMQVKRKLAAAGLASFRCDAGHTWMSAYIWVFDHPYFAVTDAAGRFAIDGVPPGAYTLRVWHEGWKRDGGGKQGAAIVVEQPVTVAAGGAPVTVDLR